MAKEKTKLRLAKREQWLASIATIIVLLCGSDYFVLRPLLHKLSALDSEIRQTRDDVVYYGKILKKKHVVEEGWDEIQEKLRQTSTADMHHTEMIAVIEKLGEETGVSLPKVSDGEVGPLKRVGGAMGDELIQYVVNVDLEGGLEQVVGFLHALESHSGLFRVRTMLLAQKGKKDERSAKGSLEVTRVLASESL